MSRTTRWALCACTRSWNPLVRHQQLANPAQPGILVHVDVMQQVPLGDDERDRVRRQHHQADHCGQALLQPHLTLVMAVEALPDTVPVDDAQQRVRGLDPVQQLALGCGAW
jgi:hypothetical protein